MSGGDIDIDYPYPADADDVASATEGLDSASSLADWCFALGRVLDNADADWLPLTAIEDALGLAEQSVAFQAVAKGVAKSWFDITWMNAFVATDDLLVVTWAKGGRKRFLEAANAGEVSR